VVVSRGYAICLLVVFSFLCLLYVYLKPFELNGYHGVYETPKDSKVVDYTWQEYLQDCGGEVIVENTVHARNIFNTKWENNQVTWRGYFAESKQMHGSWLFSSDHALNLLLKMQPSESALYPDLVLSVPSKLLSEKRSLIQSLKKGDELEFRAHVVSLGNEFKLHHLHGVDFSKTGGFKELNEILVRESTLP
jgi:hypothetical protein